MRIAILMKRYSLCRGGGEYDLVRISVSLADRGHEVHLFVHDVEGDPDPRLTFHHVPMTRLWSPLKIVSFARNAPREVEKSGIRFDVVHAMTQAYPSDLYWNGGGLQVNWLPARYGPNAMKTAWLNPRHAANLAVEKRLFEPGNYLRVVCLTRMEREQIVGHYKVPDDRYHVIPNGIDLGRFNPGVRDRFRREVREDLGLDDETRMILYVGTDGRRKGLPQLLRALAGMPSPFEGLLVIAGNDPPSRWLPDVRANCLEERVRFHGREAEVERLYAAADLTVLASVFEGFGNVVPEAMACGCPVLTSRSVGAADFVDHGEDGWVVESCDHHESYSALLREALTEADLEAVGQRAAAKVAPCTWDWSMDRLEEVYGLIREEKSQ